MYHNKKPWEEQHAGYSTLGVKDKDVKYHQQDKYGSNEKGPGSDYMGPAAAKEKDEKKENLFGEVEEGKKEENLKDEDIPFKAAKQVFSENKDILAKKGNRKKNINSIEEAIKKAIEDEKKVILMD